MRILGYSASAALLILVLTACGTSATTADSRAPILPMSVGETTVDLLAGQHIFAGTLSMVNDGNTLTVTYDTSSTDWCIVSTHLHVAQDPDDIPQNKGGLIPGRFDYSDSHACVDTVEYEVALSDFEPGTLYVAAHAVVANTADEQTIELTSAVGDTVYGPIYVDPFSTPVDWTDHGPKSAVQAENELYENGFGTFWGDESEHGIITPADIPGVKWISTADQTEVWDVNSWRYFTKPFDVPGYPVSGEVTVNADNAYWLYVNGATQSDWADFQWDNALKTHAFTPMHGENLLAFIAMNFGVEDVEQYRNPNGLVYKAGVRYLPTETAWADGVSPGRNWSMYTEVDVCAIPDVDTTDLGTDVAEITSIEVVDSPLDAPESDTTAYLIQEDANTYLLQFDPVGTSLANTVSLVASIDFCRDVESITGIQLEPGPPGPTYEDKASFNGSTVSVDFRANSAADYLRIVLEPASP